MYQDSVQNFTRPKHSNRSHTIPMLCRVPFQFDTITEPTNTSVPSREVLPILRMTEDDIGYQELRPDSWVLTQEVRRIKGSRNPRQHKSHASHNPLCPLIPHPPRNQRCADAQAHDRLLNTQKHKKGGPVSPSPSDPSYQTFCVYTP